LLNTFYKIERIENSNDTVKASLEINRDHEILKGHFPDQPVVPGVVMMQIIKELVEQHHHQSLMITEADQVKFLSIINPVENNKVDATISMIKNDAGVTINATLAAGTLIYFKLKAVLKAVGK
jgi:3-hydroxyacyl-[acyl-carrier-protein] dehydratase